MPIYYIQYDLQDGFIHNWIVGGPQAIPVHDLDQFMGTEEPRLQIARHYYEEDSGITETPAEQGL